MKKNNIAFYLLLFLCSCTVNDKIERADESSENNDKTEIEKVSESIDENIRKAKELSSKKYFIDTSSTKYKSEESIELEVMKNAN